MPCSRGVDNRLSAKQLALQIRVVIASLETTTTVRHYSKKRKAAKVVFTYHKFFSWSMQPLCRSYQVQYLAEESLDYPEAGSRNTFMELEFIVKKAEIRQHVHITDKRQ